MPKMYGKKYKITMPTRQLLVHPLAEWEKAKQLPCLAD